MTPRHLLEQLYLPDRYEALEQHLGADLVRVLVAPEPAMEIVFHAVAQAVTTKKRGLLLPAWGDSGTGKSTLANSLSHFYGSRFAPSVPHFGSIDDEALEQTSRLGVSKIPPNDTRVLPIIVDGREGEPPTNAELSAVKRFLRTPSGSRSVVLWLETSEQRAASIGGQFEEIAGKAPTPLPIRIGGPPRGGWASIARTTMELSNQVADLDSLGVDPSDYRVEEFQTVGDYLAKIAEDFNALTRKLLAELNRPTSLVIGFASETRDVGTIAQLTEGRRVGLLNSHALIGATPSTDVGRWWAERQGLLTSTIVRLDARAFILPPTLTVTVLRRSGSSEVRTTLQNAGAADVDPIPYWQRSALGNFLSGTETDTLETRGNPSEAKQAAFAALSKAGHFQAGRDRALNVAIAASLQLFLAGSAPGSAATAERQLETQPGGGEITPDITVDDGASRTCIEIAWRSGDWARSANRAAMAEYILGKLKRYAGALGWSS